MYVLYSRSKTRITIIFLKKIKTKKNLLKHISRHPYHTKHFFTSSHFRSIFESKYHWVKWYGKKQRKTKDFSTFLYKSYDRHEYKMVQFSTLCCSLPYHTRSCTTFIIYGCKYIWRRRGECGRVDRVCYVTPILISVKYLSTSSIWICTYEQSILQECIKSFVKECINVDLIVFGYDANSFDNGISKNIERKFFFCSWEIWNPK